MRRMSGVVVHALTMDKGICVIGGSVTDRGVCVNQSVGTERMSRMLGVDFHALTREGSRASVPSGVVRSCRAAR